MIGYLFGKVFGTRNDRQLKRLRKIVSVINALEPQFAAMNDDALRQQSDIFRARLAQGESLDNLLPEAFAVAREAGKRALKMRHFDVQLMGGMVLHEGKISEMRTGEGKTLVATLPVYLNALTGKGVHVVTVNDYLARRDAAWMSPIYHALGLTVGAIHSGQPQEEKMAAYRCDVTYGTNNEFGFDYLRDNMVLRVDERVQRGLSYAIVDEVDSILIDESRTPLIISGALQDTSQLYKRINSMAGKLRRQTEESPGHFSIDEKTRQVDMTEDGHQFLEQLLIRDGLLEANDNLYAPKNLSLLHHVNSALRAHYLFSRDVEYIVQNDQVVLIDEHSGRMMSGRRLAEGLHQALEAKEGVKIQNESQTLASTTFQNYFRLYKKLSGMTGTAETEAQEFYEIYRLDVVILPTNQVSRRQDLNDFIFMSKEEKFTAIIVDIRDCVAKNSPVLVGTASVEMSEEMSRRLTKAGINHQVLNAKYHEKEAEIIAQAGRPGAVTVATNMAGRGTDIVLGGKWEAEIAGIENPTDEEIEKHRLAWQQRHDQVVAAGGLHILGTERHESRRIDNQLRGRAGRQGDPGLTRFYLSLEDDLMRIFASDRMRGMMQAIGMNNGEAIEHRMVTKSIENAQRKVEGRNFDMRKQLLEFDDVANDQRQVIFGQRNDILEADDISDILRGVRADVVNTIMDDFIPPQSIEDQWDIPGLEAHLRNELGLTLPISQWLDEESDLHEEGLRVRIADALQQQYDDRHRHAGELLQQVEKQIMLQVIDQSWKEHLSSMDQLRQGVYLRAYAQKNPKQEYKRESFEMFRNLLENIRYETVRVLSRIEIARREDIEAMEEKHRKEQESLRLRHEQAAAMSGGAPDDQQDTAANPSTGYVEQVAPFVRETEKVGRNDACPCGSGKKYKQCHGKLV